MTKSEINFQTPILERALSILELLAKNKNGLGISDIMRLLDIPKNSVFRITGTLHQRGYLNRDPKTKMFTLSRKMVDVGLFALGDQDIIEQSIDVMREIRDITKETTLLGIVSGSKGTVMNQLPSTNPIKLMVEVGMSFNLYCSAPGKAYMAFLPEEELKELLTSLKLTKYTDRTITSISKLSKELKKIRAQGYSIDFAEEFEGIHCVGVPILNHLNYPIALIWIAGSSFSLPEKKFPSVAKVLV